MYVQNISGDCNFSATINSTAKLPGVAHSQLSTSKLAMGCLSAPQAQSACGSQVCATVLFGQTESACQELRDYSPDVAVLPAAPAINATSGLGESCVPVPGTSSVYASLRCTPVAAPSQCRTELNQLCGAAKRAGAGNCFVCCGMHQSPLKAAGCTSPDIDTFCG